MIQSSYPSAIRMNFVFCNNPWIMPPEPDIIRDIFVRRGTIQHFPAGTRLTHGGVAGSVYFVNKGLATFGYFDASAVFQVLNIILPGRTVGDLDSLTSDPCTIIAECIKPCVLSVLTKEEWQDAIRSSVATMEAYALSANKKHQCAMEGLINNRTLPLPLRLKRLLLALIQTHYTLHQDRWNPCPASLTVTDLAKVLSASRPWVSRTLSAWIAEGLMKKDGRSLLIKAELFNDLYAECGKTSAASE